MIPSRRVAVTGVGIVSPLGVGRTAFWRALAAGQSGIVEQDGGRLAAPVSGFDAKELIGAAHLRRMDELSRMIVAASRLALDDAGLGAALAAPERTGIVVASAIGNVRESVAFLDRVLAKGPAAASPMIFPNLVANAPAGYVAMEIGALGENFTVAEGEVSGEHAIALGSDLVRNARADVVLAGGGDQLSDLLFEIYGATRSLAGQRGGRAWSSPYDEARSGLVLGEGAAMLALEPLEQARARGARVIAEIEGYETFRLGTAKYDWPERSEVPERLRRFVGSSRFETRTSPGWSGDPMNDFARGATKQTLGRDVHWQLVCGSANSTPRLDAYEVDLVARLLGEGAGGATLTSVKGAIGEHGACGALTTAAACLAIAEQAVPPLANLRDPIRPPVPLGFAPRRARAQRIARALVLGIARGGAGIALSLS